MSRAVSVVLPSMGTRDLLKDNLPALIEEVQRRGQGDEIVVVDDTGQGVLAEWMETRFPEVRVVTRAENGGFARALLSGVQEAKHSLIFSMNTDVRVRPDFLERLVESLGEDVFAVVPKVLLDGKEDEIESWTSLEVRRGFVEVRQPALEEPGSAGPEAAVDVAFAVGGTFLFRRQDFLDRPFDPLFEPFYWEDVDLCWQAWRRGKRTLYQPSAVVEHHHRGTIGHLVPKEIVRAAIEKNRLLFDWKNLDGKALSDHVLALHRWLVDAWLADSRRELLWINLALEQMEQACAGRRSSVAGPGFMELLERLRS